MMKKIIRQTIAISIVVVIGVFFLTGCKGAGGKKAATEALEIIEKKASSKAASAIERETGQAERTVVRETESYRPARSSRPHHHSSYGDDEENYEPQVYTVTCSQCGGAGAVYMLDYYGNIQYDYYGNLMVSQCPYCNGTGVVLVTQ